MISISKQIEFYKWQLVELGREWEVYYISHLRELIDKHECALGELHGLDEVRGNIIVRFPVNMAVRLNSLYTMYYFFDKNLADEQLSFKSFVQTVGVISTGENSVQSIYILDRSQDYLNIAFSGAPIEFFEKLKSAKKQQLSVNILLGKTEPPYRYLKRLEKFTEDYADVNFLDFKPNTVLNRKFFGEDKVLSIINELKTTSEVIIQGPPGTGKSSLVANILKNIADGKRICVTALTNRALVELAKKLKDSSIEKLVYKTNLSVNEKKELSFLKTFDENIVIESFIQLTTYYKLSEKIVNLKLRKPVFDILIIEEASQAFFTTLKAFTLLANKIIIIGDPNQLTPIVLNNSKRLSIHLKIDKLINGLDTWMYKPDTSFFMLEETYRLNEFNTWLTNSFYENKLISNTKKALNINIDDSYLNFFDSYNTTTLWRVNKFSEIEDLTHFMPKLKDLLLSIIKSNNIETAILTPYKEDVIALQLGLSDVLIKGKDKVIIETIDRVQGMTVDVVILVLRLGKNPQFIFDNNRFNVATSRTKHYNIIITDNKFEMLTSLLSSEVRTYFNKLLSC
ncbi:AAA domain-containing protein [Sphingobacterium sp. Lzh-3]|uniref:AAA domain-containing protein n=1 Tax=Sphingobacterium sp. Lzh-3 TaxID=3382150 RepID=UPI00398CCDAE